VKKEDLMLSKFSKKSLELLIRDMTSCQNSLQMAEYDVREYQSKYNNRLLDVEYYSQRIKDLEIECKILESITPA